MLKRFLHTISQYPDYQKKKYLLAVSGGIDSMVLLDLMQKSGLDFAVAHCNFQLRGPESDADEKFVKKICQENNIPCFVKHCPVEKNTNIQTEARRLRYQWFEKLAREKGFDYILTAHHADDNLETFFINLIRKTGLKGLTGIPETNLIKRPLLIFRREEIVKYARKNKIDWREDISNQSDKYLRNALRLKLIPLLENIKPGSTDNILKSMELLRLSWQEENEWYENLEKQLIIRKKDEQILSLEKLIKIKNNRLFLYKWLAPYGFKHPEEIQKLFHAQTGKKMESEAWILIKQGNQFILTPRKSPVEKALVFHKIPLQIRQPVKLAFSMMSEKEIPEEVYKKAPPNTIYIDAGKFKPPFQIRPWKPGDRMQPLGMKRSKKISDILTDLKIPLHRKKQVFLLLSNDTPVWLIGIRPDERFKITSETRKILRIKLLNSNDSNNSNKKV